LSSFDGINTKILKYPNNSYSAERLANSQRVNHLAAGFSWVMGIYVPGFGLGVWPLCTLCNFKIAFETQVIIKLRKLVVA
jgi:hypothetical protein